MIFIREIGTCALATLARPVVRFLVGLDRDTANAAIEKFFASFCAFPFDMTFSRGTGSMALPPWLRHRPLPYSMNGCRLCGSLFG